MLCCACQENDATEFRLCNHYFCDNCKVLFETECRESSCSEVVRQGRIGLSRDDLIIYKNDVESKLEASELEALERLKAFEERREVELKQMIQDFKEATIREGDKMIRAQQAEGDRQYKIIKRLDSEIEFAELAEMEPKIRAAAWPEENRTIRLSDNSVQASLRDADTLVKLSAFFSTNHRDTLCCIVENSKGMFYFEVEKFYDAPECKNARFQTTRARLVCSRGVAFTHASVVGVKEGSTLISLETSGVGRFILVELDYPTESARSSIYDMYNYSFAEPTKIARREARLLGYFTQEKCVAVLPNLFRVRVRSHHQTTIVYWIITQGSRPRVNSVRDSKDVPDVHHHRLKINGDVIWSNYHLLLPRV
jgi:hypothetical protein